ncbi:MAG: sulfite exporter TauE/SafE family protein [Spirochaetes bacterium]|nr:sulfite exporter TauE/SafE family protein [Spirochaetota bacterium]
MQFYLTDFFLFDSFSSFLLFGSIFFLGQFVYAALGFGSGMVTISLLALFVGDINLIVPLFILICLPTEITVFIKDRKHLKPRQTGLFMLFITPGLLLGGYILKVVQDDSLVFYFGIIIVFLSLYYLLLEERFPVFLQGKKWIGITGSISGFLGGTYGISGPPLIFYFKSQKLSKTDFRLTLLTIFLFMTIIRIIFFLFLGLLEMKTFVSALTFFPFVVTAIWLGNKVHHHINEHFFKKVTTVFLLVNGILLIAKNFF